MGKRARQRSRAVRMTEASVVDGMTFAAISDAVLDAVRAKLGLTDATSSWGVWIQDISDTWVVYNVDGADEATEGLWKLSYSMADDGTVTLDGDPTQVQVTYATEARDGQIVEHIAGRLLEARANDDDGRRVFRVQIIESGDSMNANRYPQPVLTAAIPLYEGAKAFDHHRTDLEKKTSTIDGLVGEYRNVAVNASGLEGDLALLPSAVHTAEALDASLAAQAQGRRPLVGISHDVMAHARVVADAGRQFREATQIVQVHSADVVADPSAGGRPLRMVAGGIYEPINPRKGTDMDLKQLLALLREATAEKRVELLKEHQAILDGVGLTADDVTKMLATEVPDAAAIAAKAKADQDAAADADAKAKADAEGKTAEPVAEQEFPKDSILGRQLVTAAVTEAKLSDKAGDVIRGQLPERFTESEVSRLVENAQALLEGAERAGLTPGVPHLVVGDEAHDKKCERLDLFFQGNFTEGYSSLKDAYIDITGNNPYDRRFRDLDFNRLVMRESIGGLYDSEGRGAEQMTESFASGTWSLTLGDSITRRLIAEYKNPQLQTWRQLTSSIVPVTDFRTQRLDRQGQYGALPVVAEGTPYQPLTTPTEEEATYALSKYGGTEDITLEAIANDDRRVIPKIPQKLARAAGRTIRDFVWNFLKNNATASYDSVALFASGHTNTTAVALSHAAMSQLTAKMERQTGYDDDVALGLYPRLLVVPPELRELGFELTTGQFAVPATTPGATAVPNMFQGTQLLVEPYLSDTNDWFLVADPADVPLLEVGFYGGREDPELFSQVDPTVGSQFNADKLTYKIRYIFGAAILDHRGFQRGTQ